MTTELTATLENYLATILQLQREKSFARSRDIARTQGVAKSAVTAALKALAAKGLVRYEPYEPVTLTQAGRKYAEQIDLRHRIISDFLERVLALEPDRADSIASGMEHVVDRDALERLVCFLAFIGRRRDDGRNWLDDFRRFVSRTDRDQTCRQCVQAYVTEIGAPNNSGN